MLCHNDYDNTDTDNNIEINNSNKPLNTALNAWRHLTALHTTNTNKISHNYYTHDNYKESKRAGTSYNTFQLRTSTKGDPWKVTPRTSSIRFHVQNQRERLKTKTMSKQWENKEKSSVYTTNTAVCTCFAFCGVLSGPP